MSFDASTSAYNPSEEVHIRPAQIGDICLMLEPTQRQELALLHQRHRSLAARWGGLPIERIHLTCQRFACRHVEQIQEFTISLQRRLPQIASLPFTAVALRTLYVPVRKSCILKWEIEVTDALRQFTADVALWLQAASITPLYRPGFVSSLVAALRDVPEIPPDELDNVGDFPCHLFTAEKAVLSQIHGPDAFEILAEIPFRNCDQ